jgi:uncharacterized protein YggT (Ycf19 family)
MYIQRTHPGSSAVPPTYNMRAALASIVWTIAGIINGLLLLRFLLRLLGANAGAGFTSFIYALSRPFVAPFQTVFPPTPLNGFVLDWNILLAMAVYALVAWFIVRLLVPPVTVIDDRPV